jgi:hypothetical protein
MQAHETVETVRQDSGEAAVSIMSNLAAAGV